MNCLVNNHDMWFTNVDIIDGNGGMNDLKIIYGYFSWIVSRNIDNSVILLNY